MRVIFYCKIQPIFGRFSIKFIMRTSNEYLKEWNQKEFLSLLIASLSVETKDEEKKIHCLTSSEIKEEDQNKKKPPKILSDQVEKNLLAGEVSEAVEIFVYVINECSKLFRDHVRIPISLLKKFFPSLVRLSTYFREYFSHKYYFFAYLTTRYMCQYFYIFFSLQMRFNIFV